MSYLALSGELRNQIISYVLQPGDIYIRPTSTHSPNEPPNDDHDANNVPQPGVQMLASSKAAYLEGYQLFHSSNIFHLPSGSFQDTFRWAEALQPKHKGLVKRIGLTCCASDLTPAMTQAFSEFVKHEHDDTSTDKFSRHMALYLFGETNIKLAHVLKWRSLEEIHLTYFEKKA